MAESGRCTSPPKTNASNPSQYTKKEEPSSRLTPYLHTLDEYIRTFAHHVRVILSESRIDFVGVGLWGWASVMSMYLVPCT